jgi:predicted RNase H-like nuclease (RuvC/YqgF family)
LHPLEWGMQHWNAMRVKRQITVTAIVTDKLKEEMLQELQESIDRVDASQRELEARSRRFLLQLPSADMVSAARRELEAETRRHEQLRRELKERQEQVAALTLGERIPYTTLEGDVEINVGDNLIDKLSGAEIVIKDGVVQEIKEA